MELNISSSLRNVSTKNASYFADNQMLCSNEIPVSGDYKVGDFIISNHQRDGIFGWVCTEAGNPGTWEEIKLGGGSGSGNGSAAVFLFNMETFNTSRSSIPIGIEGFNKDRDTLEVYYNGLLLLEGVHYNISEDSQFVLAIGEEWNASGEDGQEMIFKAIKLISEINCDYIITKQKNVVTVDARVTEVEIGIPTFSKSTQMLTVFKNSTYLTEGVDYAISEDSKKIICLNNSWNKYEEPDYNFTFEVLRNEVRYNPEEGVIGLEHLKDELKTYLDTATKLDPTRYYFKEEVDNRIDPIELMLDQKVNKQEIGSLTSLDTKTKTSVVDAINEVYEMALNVDAAAVIELLNKEIDGVRQEIAKLRNTQEQIIYVLDMKGMSVGVVNGYWYDILVDKSHMLFTENIGVANNNIIVLNPLEPAEIKYKEVIIEFLASKLTYSHELETHYKELTAIESNNDIMNINKYSYDFNIDDEEVIYNVE